MCQMIAIVRADEQYEAEIGTLAELRAWLGLGEIVCAPTFPKLSPPGKDSHCLCGVDRHATAAANGYESSEEYPGSFFMEWRRSLS